MAFRNLLQCCGVRPSAGNKKKKLKAAKVDARLVGLSTIAVGNGSDYDRCQIWSPWTGWRSRRVHLDTPRRIVFVSRHSTVTAPPLLLTPRSAQPPNHRNHDQEWKVFSLVAAKHLAYTVRHSAQYKQSSLIVMLVSAGNERLTMRVCGSAKTIGDWISVLAQLVVPKSTATPMRRLTLCPVHGMKAQTSTDEESHYSRFGQSATTGGEPKLERQVYRPSPSAPELHEKKMEMTQRQAHSLSDDDRSTINPADWALTVAQENKLYAARSAFHAGRLTEVDSASSPLSDQQEVHYRSGPLIEEFSTDTLTVSLHASDDSWSSESIVDPAEQRSVYGGVPVIEQSFTRGAHRMPPVYLDELEDRLEQRRQSDRPLLTFPPIAPWSTTVMNGGETTASVVSSLSELIMTMGSANDPVGDDVTQMTAPSTSTMKTSSSGGWSRNQMGMLLVTLHCALYIIAIVAVGVIDSHNQHAHHKH